MTGVLLHPSASVTSWQDSAACIGTPASWWHPRSVTHDYVTPRTATGALYKRKTHDNHGCRLCAALRTCQRCPVQAQCLAYILDLETPAYRSGIWGGTTPAARTERAREQKRQQVIA